MPKSNMSEHLASVGRVRWPNARSAFGWWTIALLAWLVVSYGVLFLLLRERVFSPDLAASFKARPWGIYPHVALGMIGLALGPLQFHPRIQRRTAVHHTVGKIYVADGVVGGLVGVYMAAYSFGGMITHFGFGLLALLLLLTTSLAYWNVRSARYAQHRAWMIRSFALMFAAVTLRLWLPLLSMLFGEFRPAYLWVSWLCWVPNLLFAEWYIWRTHARPLRFGGRLVEPPVTQQVLVTAR
jgi:hypothetical protein